MIKFYSGIEVKCNKEDLNKKGVIYLITFENGKTYIGQTTKQLHIRISQHCTYSNCSKLKNAINKYKIFTVSILECDLNISQLNLFEKFYIKLFNSNGIGGYNLESGGFNMVVSDETKRKISEFNKGKKLSDETKRKISVSNKGKTAHNKGNKHKDESKVKMSESHKGKTFSDESKVKMSESHKGKTVKQVKSIPDNIIFNSCKECATYYKINVNNIHLYYNGKIHAPSGQTFVLISE